jgi:HSP20 family molecular chaperone IbpA
MKPKIEIPKELLSRFDLLNTVNGGMATQYLEAAKMDDGYRMTIQIPSVAAEDLEVEVVAQHLRVFYHIGNHIEPFYLVNFPISPDVEIEGITAHVEDDKLVVFGPFSDWAKGRSRKIDVEKD